MTVEERLLHIWFFLALAELMVLTYIMFEVWRVDVVELRERNKTIAFCEFIFMVSLCIGCLFAWARSLKKG